MIRTRLRPPDQARLPFLCSCFFSSLACASKLCPRGGGQRAGGLLHLHRPVRPHVWQVPPQPETTARRFVCLKTILIDLHKQSAPTNRGSGNDLWGMLASRPAACSRPPPGRRPAPEREGAWLGIVVGKRRQQNGLVNPVLIHLPANILLIWRALLRRTAWLGITVGERRQWKKDRKEVPVAPQGRALCWRTKAVEAQ